MANTKITSRVIADNAVTTAAIADDAITSAKLDTNIAVAGTLTVTGDITGTLATAAQPNITSVGTLTGLTVNTGTTNGAEVSIISTNTANSGANNPTLKLYRSGVLSGGFGQGGLLEFAGQNASGTEKTYATISGDIFDTTASSEDGYLTFKTMQAGTLTTALEIDHQGFVGIGTTTPAVKLAVNGGTDNVIASFTSTDNGSYIQFMDNNATGHYIGTVGGSLAILNTSNVERMRIHSDGDVRIGTTGTLYSSGEKMSLYHSGGQGLGIKTVGDTSYQPLGLWNAASGTAVLVRFAVGSGGGSGGEINSNGTTTVYGQPSDYRLKENIVPLPSATAKVNALNPVRFNMISNAEGITVDGFIAHEVQEIVPEAVSYEKDGMKEEEYEITPEVLDEDGNVVTEAVWGTRTVPQYQQMDASKLIPIMVKTIQELEARITELENA